MLRIFLRVWQSAISEMSCNWNMTSTNLADTSSMQEILLAQMKEKADICRYCLQVIASVVLVVVT